MNHPIPTHPQPVRPRRGVDALVPPDTDKDSVPDDPESSAAQKPEPERKVKVNLAELAWLTRAEAGEYARLHPHTINDAVREFQRTGGERGLEGYQRGGARTPIRIPRTGLDRWLRGEAPKGKPPKRLRLA